MTLIEQVATHQSNPQVAAFAEKTFQRLLERSSTDLEFRSKLLTDSRAALSEFIGAPLPESFNVAFVENKANYTIVLPQAIDTAAELSEQDLENVAGGALPLILVASSMNCVASALGVAATLVEIFGD
jgi:hypothetical protein